MSPTHQPAQAVLPDLPFGMTEIEERLRGPEASAFREELLELLDRAAMAVEEDLSAGLPPADYTRATSLSRALAAAKEIVLAFPST
ncbi:EscE/YscE/SsaE family type III secretion system needle protein co-chaperone [Prosthecodimorpha staleyi]|uniref:Uncharacterized protein n=1 Tax=Prosthecodimorpha staleyi TaxID=2840188 RepID=A0A947D5U6_9HYPH|nr:EscE/YscE/SsaE family type III secretion system needle protein co-chaperone [Prosthecodimorpha staleyi]MBT9288747.1 hypothetical protein [Prosthecodimorpha staleyi]